MLLLASRPSELKEALNSCRGAFLKLILDAVRKHPDKSDILVACGDVMMFKRGSLTAMTYATSTYRRVVTILEKGTDVVRLREIEGRLKKAQQTLAVCRDSEE